MTHTPGPWLVTPELGCKDIGPEDWEHDRIYAIAGTYGISPEAEDEANAVLIAAAPELLRAAKALSKEAYYDGIEPEFTIDPQTLAELDAAIAQAEGGAR